MAAAIHCAKSPPWGSTPRLHDPADATLYVLDAPTTGRHCTDIECLIGGTVSLTRLSWTASRSEVSGRAVVLH